MVTIQIILWATVHKNIYETYQIDRHRDSYGNIEKSLYIPFNFPPLLLPKENLHNVEHE